MLAPRTWAFLAGACLVSLAACLGGASDSEDVDEQAAAVDPKSVDMADYMIPDCDHAGDAWQIEGEQFRTVPMGVSGGRGRFVIVKSVDGSGYEEWSVDEDWMRLRADTTWAYELPDHTWCDVKCGQNDASSCQQRWNTNASDPKNGLHPAAPWVFTLYADPQDGSIGAPITPRKMSIAKGGSFTFTSSIVIRGAQRDSCADCAVNFDSRGKAVGRQVTARRHAGWQGFSDVVQLHVDSGPGAGEDAYFARGIGWVGFNGKVVSGKVSSSQLPQMLCGGATPASICSVTGGTAAPAPTGTSTTTTAPPPSSCACKAGVDNFCLYGAKVAGCAMTQPGGYCDPNGDGGFGDADWGRGYSEYQKQCGGGSSSSSSSTSSSSSSSSTSSSSSGSASSCACKAGVDNFCLYGAKVSGCAMTQPGGYCDPNGDGNFADADWVRGYDEYQKQCAGTAPPPPPPSCACKAGVDNFCLYGAKVSGCAMTQPGGYCDPNGDGSFSDADWVRGYDEYHAQCK